MRWFVKKNRAALFLLSLFSFLFLGAQESDYLNQANFQTATRCVELARDQLVAGNYIDAFDFIEVGLFYDESISDLWYLHALLLEYQNKEIFKIIDSVEKALEKKSWLYYTPEAARILYAKYALATGDMHAALKILDEKPVLIQSDAEYLRCLASYRLQDREKAHEIISNARRLFPNDARFPLLFFQNERLMQSNEEAFQALSTSLLAMLEKWKTREPDILVYASFFVDEDSALRYLKEYRLTEKKDPLYILAFLEHGLYTEEQAIQALFQIADRGIAAPVFFELLSVLQAPQSFAFFAENLEDFSGRLDFDSNRDGADDFFVYYKYGRPSTIVYDKNADDALNWIIECDYGLAEKCIDYEKSYEVYFGRYPFVDSLSSFALDEERMEMRFVDASVTWEAYELELVPIFEDKVFYLPVLNRDSQAFDLRTMQAFANEIVIYPKENEHKKIRFSLQNNRIKTALYTLKDKPYAYGFFENGLLQFRNVDRDGNGSYETTEFYAFDPELKSEKNKEANLYTELFGSFEMPEGYYLSEVRIDTNENGIPDFRESYLPDGRQITAWDENENGSWDLAYEKNMQAGDFLEEKVFFINPLNNEEVEIVLENGIPTIARYADRTKKILKEKDLPFYWLGESSYTRHALKAYTELAKTDIQGMRILIDDHDMRGFRMLAIKIDTFYFGELIEDETIY